MPALRRVLGVPVLGACAALLAACSSGGGATSLPPPPGSQTSAAPSPISSAPSSSAPSSSAPSTPSSGAPSSGAPSSAAPTSSPATTPAGGGRCHTSELTFRLGASDAGAGQRLQVVVITNTGGRSCTLFGYAGLQLVDGSRKFLPTTVTRGNGNAADPGAKLVTLAAGGTASFAMSFSSCVNGPAGCSSSTYLEVTPPDERDYLFDKADLMVFQGKIAVSAIVAGSAGPA